jgi:excisionase family DNA binding protein
MTWPSELDRTPIVPERRSRYGPPLLWLKIRSNDTVRRCGVRTSGTSDVTQIEAADDHLLTINEIAERMRVSKMTVYRLIHHGALPALRIGRCFRVSATEFARFLAAAQSS